MNKQSKIFFGIVLLAAILAGGIYYWQNLRGIGPAFRDPAENIVDQLPDSSDENIPEAVNNTNFPLKLPKGFAISIFAKNLSGARVMVFDSFGNLWVSQPDKGSITQVEIQNGKVVRNNEIFRNLRKPHGLALDGTMLYFAEETKVSRVPLYSDGNIEKLVDLPAGGRHTTRTLHFGSDGRLYVSIGSTCDVCNEKDERIAAIYSMNKDGSDFKKVASGLRNAVFMATNPVDGKLWATEMGRDNLGDELPPDEINIIDMDPASSAGRAAQQPLDFGWPTCYGKNIHDTNFDKNTYIQNPCNDKVGSHIDLPAHSAPLGLAFVPEESFWPQEYWHDLIVAFHGSWNRSEPTGYKLTRMKLDSNGNFEGMEDFISGWLAADGKTSLGRPVDVVFHNRDMYISDDKAGVVYKVSYYSNEETSSADKSNLIRPSNVKANDVLQSGFVVEGEARGAWFFEATFPVKLYDGNGKLLTGTYAQAEGEWMTENFVRFKSQPLNFSKPSTETGTLVLEKDAPSGLPEHRDELRIPVRFSTNVSLAACQVTGCSSHICSDQEVNTTCEFREEYACYKTAKCERQASGQCGWTQTEELKSCLAQK